jgi:hypothetical protein
MSAEGAEGDGDERGNRAGKKKEAIHAMLRSQFGF